ncbi:response regulator transcription factor [Stenotrophomonas indicatrix]|uniref:response regulator transcription factor n=1 Tax=Stenotrophomonas indicatrix TaxID=2045451 RepID=UPI00300A9F37
MPLPAITSFPKEQLSSPTAHRTLIADDHPVIRLGLRKILAQMGHAVVGEANTPSGLLELAASVAPDVVITDINMPGGTHADGIALIRSLRIVLPTAPVIALTMADNDHLFHLLRLAGANVVIKKSATIDDLPSVIESLLCDHHIAGPPSIATAHRQASSAPLDNLSAREVDVVRQLAMGLSVTQIAQRHCRRAATVSKQKHAAMRKLGVLTELDLYTLLASSKINGI